MPSLRFGIPDIELSCDSGTKVNPASFAGHELIVLFCPTDAAEAGQEIAAYRKHCADFVARDAWLLTFADQCGDVAVEGADRVMTVPDPDEQAPIASCVCPMRTCMRGLPSGSSPRTRRNSPALTERRFCSGGAATCAVIGTGPDMLTTSW